jgi:hypothetical protein
MRACRISSATDSHTADASRATRARRLPSLAQHVDPGVDRQGRHRSGNRTTRRNREGSRPRGVVQSRRVSQLCRLGRAEGCGIIARRRSNSAHLHRPRRAKQNLQLGSNTEPDCFPENCLWEAVGKPERWLRQAIALPIYTLAAPGLRERRPRPPRCTNRWRPVAGIAPA